MKKAYLVLADGSTLCGSYAGAVKNVIGELVFTTSMVGYNETLTDPSYYGQIVVQTFPEIGDYGVIPEDFESAAPRLTGYIARNLCDTPNNFRNQGKIADFLSQSGIPAITDIDTRQLTRLIRSGGVLNAAICERPDFFTPGQIKNYRVTDAVKATSCAEIHTLKPQNTLRKIALLDYGTKANICRCLLQRGCEVAVFPFDTPAQKLLEGGFDGLVLSNGPGDPEENVSCITELEKLLGRLPIMGVCLGHQLLALAAGGLTARLAFGHRGSNQPVTDLVEGHTFVTTQNHGYQVLSQGLAGKVRYVNANDGSVEGLDYPQYNAFSVQFHPEAAAGPRDSGFLFDRFIAMTEETKNAKG